MIPKGYKLNPDEVHVAKIELALDTIEHNTGKRFCPCRPKRTEETVCPCVKHFDDCVCRLYVKE